MLALIGSLRDKDAQVCWYATQAIEKIAPEVKHAGPRLIQTVKDPNLNVQGGAIAVASRTGAPVVKKTLVRRFRY